MESLGFWIVSMFLWTCMFVQRFELSVAVNEEGMTLLSFKDGSQYSSLSKFNNNHPNGNMEPLNTRKASHHSIKSHFPTPNRASNDLDTPAATAVPSAGGGEIGASVIACISIGASIFLLVLLYLVYLLWHQYKKDVTVIPWATGLSGKLQKAFVTGKLITFITPLIYFDGESCLSEGEKKRKNNHVYGSHVAGTPSLRRSELEVACEDFSNIIGYLSNCELYKGTLSSGIEIAVTFRDVTLAENWSEHDQTQYRNKISVLSKINHKNFMNLIGYCEEEEPFSRMMVFEYAPNGTLFEHLHIKEAEPLEWSARLRIAMGIVYCLEHIEMLSPSVTLRNINSSCIYLSDDYAAKVSDLEFWTEEQKDLLSESSNEDNIVYKFGIILLEIISGRRPFSDDDGLLVLWASSYLNGKRPLIDMVDQTLTSVDEEIIIALIDVVRSCINKNPNKALAMEDVAARMRQITSITPEQAYPRLTPIWWSEIEIITQ